MRIENQYLPSEEETLKAESIITDEQKKLSDVREFDAKSGIGLEMRDMGQHEKRLVGNVKGHNLDIVRQEAGDASRGMYQGTVDGMELDQISADKLWQKYAKFGMDDEAINKARQQLGEEVKRIEVAAVVDELLA